MSHKYSTYNLDINVVLHDNKLVITLLLTTLIQVHIFVLNTQLLNVMDKTIYIQHKYCFHTLIFIVKRL